MAEYLGLNLDVCTVTDEDIRWVIPPAVWYLESFDEDCVSGAIANFFTSRRVAEQSNCVLVGEGADELFGGYLGELKGITDPDERERVSKKLVDIAYGTALRRLDRGWLSNSVHYRMPFLDAAVVAFSKATSLDLKVHYDETRQRDVEKWILRKACERWLPEEIANRPKQRFASGTGVDSIMDELTADKVTDEEFRANPRTESGMKLNSPKELYYYRVFREHFPLGYEHLTVRWDPFK